MWASVTWKKRNFGEAWAAENRLTWRMCIWVMISKISVISTFRVPNKFVKCLAPGSQTSNQQQSQAHYWKSIYVWLLFESIHWLITYIRLWGLICFFLSTKNCYFIKVLWPLLKNLRASQRENFLSAAAARWGGPFRLVFRLPVSVLHCVCPSPLAGAGPRSGGSYRTSDRQFGSLSFLVAGLLVTIPNEWVPTLSTFPTWQSKLQVACKPVLSTASLRLPWRRWQFLKKFFLHLKYRLPFCSFPRDWKEKHSTFKTLSCRQYLPDKSKSSHPFSLV